MSRPKPGLFSLSALISRGGLHQCLSEKSSQGEPARGQHVPFSSHVQAHTPGESRVFAPVGMEGTRETDSPLEGSGFEPLVPLPSLSSIRAARAEIIGRSTDVFGRDREFDVSALQGRLSNSCQSQCSTDPGLIAGTWHRPLFLTRDRWFESGSLQRGVCELTPPISWRAAA